MDGVVQKLWMEERDIYHLPIFLPSFLRNPMLGNGKDLKIYKLLVTHQFVQLGEIWWLPNDALLWGLKISVQATDQGSIFWKKLFLDWVLCVNHCPYLGGPSHLHPHLKVGYGVGSNVVELELLKKMFDLFAECLLSQDSIIPKDVVGNYFWIQKKWFLKALEMYLFGSQRRNQRKTNPYYEHLVKKLNIRRKSIASYLPLRLFCWRNSQ